VRQKTHHVGGLRGAGKTTLGAALARALRRPLVELDKEIERRGGYQLSEVSALRAGQAIGASSVAASSG